MRVQGIGLKHHGQVAPGRADFGDVATVQLDGAVRHFLKPGNQAQQCGFTAARRPDKYHELTVVDLKINAFDDREAFKTLVQIVDSQVGHSGPPISIFI